MFCKDCRNKNIQGLKARGPHTRYFCRHNVNWDASLDGLLHAKKRAENEFGMVIGIIAITSRGMGIESCIKTVDWAIRHSQHVQAVDLADGETLFPIRDFARPILKAKEAGLKVTIHSGEDTPASAVIETIETVSPDRIGHGIHIIQDIEAVELVKERVITLEINPWSNYLTNSVRTIEEH